MGSLFSKPKTGSQSALSPEQEALLGQLSEFIRPQIGAGNPELDALMKQLMDSQGTTAQVNSERMFREALLNPAVETFNRSIKPSIAGDYASIGGTLSSRRDKSIAEAGEGVVRGAGQQFASILPQVMAFPTQQTLSQIQGLGEIQRQRFTPFQNAIQFALQPTRNTTQQPAGPGWGLLNAGIGLAGFGLGAGAFGGGEG
jgi:hypothetical protein